MLLNLMHPIKILATITCVAWEVHANVSVHVLISALHALT